MDCGSNYTWIADEDMEQEIVLDMDQNHWNNEDAFDDAALAPPPPAPLINAPISNLDHKKKISRKIRKADTNVISVKFRTLAEDVKIATGDHIFCKTCKALLSAVSVVTSKNNEQIWNCEYCETENSISIDPEEIPTAESMDYILGSSSENIVSNDSNIIIFCIDISGSMGVSYELAGKVQLRGHEKLQQLSSLNTERTATGQMADQFLPNERRDITYITRLQCVQAAISAQLEKMESENPNRRVGIVTFNNEVQVIGDGTHPATIVAGDKLSNHDELIQIGNQVAITSTIHASRKALSEKLFALEEGGSTALGPALVVSLGMTQKYPGSKIVICTDGISNVGLGSLDDLVTDEQKQSVSSFYEQLGHNAKAQGVIVSVISIKGTDCSLESLGALADLTAGEVDRVDPMQITKNFHSILSLPVIATHVTVSLLVHKGLFIRNEIDEEDEKESQRSLEVRDIGNVTQESTTSFEYGVKRNYKKKKNSTS